MPGKRTLIEELAQQSPVQKRAAGPDTPAVHEAAAKGISGGAGPLPHGVTIQELFGRHNVGNIQAHTDGAAAAGARAMGAEAFATGDHVAFAGTPSLHTAAHEAAHVVQQRGGVQLKGGVGDAGDAYERHADEVADAVVRGDSAEGLLDRHAGGRSAGSAAHGGAVQRIGNTPEPGIAALYAGQPTPQQRLAALEASHDPLVTYGLNPGTDEEAEVTGSASYLHKKKVDWRAELASRGGGAEPQWQPWETFQHEMGRATPGQDPNETPWFMQNTQPDDPGYRVTGGNVGRLAAVGAQRDTPAADDPQQLLGMTYQRDTMYSINRNAGAPVDSHKGTVDAGTDAGTINGWTNDVLRLVSGTDELRMQITGAVGTGPGVVTISGTILPGPVHNAGQGPGTAVQLRKDQATGGLDILGPGGAALATLAAGAWRGSLESYAFHQGRTRLNEGIGGHVPGAFDDEARNRGAGNPLNDATFNRVANRYSNPADPERGYARTLGPGRTRLNFHDADGGPHHVGWDTSVAPYRRLGGDTIFNEADHPTPGAYQNQLQPASTVNVNNNRWYHDQANRMPNRFVGGRSNSTALYMSSATMLHHQGRLSLAEAADVLAFVIADMVVSGEHSMPECMTTVVMAAGSAEPWTATPLNLAAPTETLAAWLHLVAPGIQAAMKADARASLLRLLADGAPDLKLVKVMTMLVKALP